MVHYQRRKCQALSEELSKHKIIFSNDVELVSSQPQTSLEVAKVSNVAIERSYSSDYRGVFFGPDL